MTMWARFLAKCDEDELLVLFGTTRFRSNQRFESEGTSSPKSKSEKLIRLRMREGRCIGSECSLGRQIED
jgi:hypothetical protein